MKPGARLIYTPLGDRQIRILTLKPYQEANSDGSKDADNDTICCSLEIVNFDDNPTYDALSYVWGNASNRMDITVDNQSFAVTGNLFEALTSLRLKKENRVLWIDAICINQDDNDEKSKQVRLMREIYTNTNRLLIWLGPTSEPKTDRSGSENSKLAMDLIRRVGSKLPPRTSETSLLKGDSIILEEIKTQSSPKQWDAFEKLCEHRWFTRGWVVQEVMLPFQEEKREDDRKSLVPSPKEIICGEESASWSDFVKLRTWVARNPSLSQGTLDWYITRAPLEMIRPRSLLPAFQRRSAAIMDLVFEYRSKTVTNPRDKIYAFLGLATDIHEGDVLIDYDMSEAGVYTEFARFLLTRNQLGGLPLKLLSACYRLSQETNQEMIRAGLLKEDEAEQKRENEAAQKHQDPQKVKKPKRTRVQEFNERLTMPSWVPDWTIDTPHRPHLVFEDILNTTCSFNATLRSFPPKHVEVSDDNKVLTVQGIIIDRVQEVGVEGKNANRLATKDTLNHLIPLFTSVERMQGGLIIAEYARAMYLSWEDLIKKSIPDPYCTGESREEAYWRTLCADRSMTKPAGSAVEAAYQAWKQLYRFGEYKDQIPEEVKLLFEKASLFRKAITLALSVAVRIFFVTEKKMGITLRGVKKGDFVCLIYGTNVPFILREIQPGSEDIPGKDGESKEGKTKRPVYYKLIGEAYCHGLMNGEGMRDLAGADTVDISII